LTAIANDSFNKLEAHQRIPRMISDFQTVTELADAKTQLTELRDVLVAHFAEEEEAGGFFDELRDVQPGNVPKIKELVEEHGTLLGQADSLRADLDSGTLEGLQPRIVELCEALREHHKCEHQLFLDSYLVDHGEGC